MRNIPSYVIGKMITYFGNDIKRINHALKVYGFCKSIGNCEKCAGKLADSFQQDDFLKVPYGFEEEVKNRINRKYEKNRQFFFYSLKISIAACIALVFVFSSTLNFMANTTMKTMEIKSPKFTAVNFINMKLDNFTNRIIDMEVFNNENEKK